jgi:hypothetical protein
MITVTYGQLDCYINTHHTQYSTLKQHTSVGVRHEYPWAPPTRPTAVLDKWVRPTRRPDDLSVSPTELVHGPHDLGPVW